jgi:transposase
MWYVGIDWADTHHDLVVLDEAGKKVGERRCTHSADGLSELVTYLKSFGEPEQVACIIETKQGLLITALLEAGLPL